MNQSLYYVDVQLQNYYLLVPASKLLFISITSYIITLESREQIKVPISLVGPLWIRKERKKLVNKFKSFF
jgi:hypothetical protein